VAQVLRQLVFRAGEQVGGLDGLRGALDLLDRKSVV